MATQNEPTLTALVLFSAQKWIKVGILLNAQRTSTVMWAQGDKGRGNSNQVRFY
jgi:hypothetical protein